jgi:hypothetical protein
MKVLFPEIAPVLVANGFRPVPITPGTKAPTRVPRWQKYTYIAAEDDPQFADCGTGILTGDVLGVDIDVPDVAVVKELLTWLLQTYGMAPVRFGNKPKTLALYRAAQPGQRKTQTAVYKNGELKGKVEILAKGQQFVAYGIHPDTKQPYTWAGGDPLTVPAAALPALTPEQVVEIIEHCAARLAQWGTGPAPAQPAPSQLGAAFLPPRAGIAADNDALITQRQPATRAELLRALADYAEFDVGDYDSWREVGAIIHHETGGSNEGLEIFIKYSRCLSGFCAGAEAGEEGCRSKWRSFGRSGAKPVTFGTLIHKLTTLRATRGPEKEGDLEGPERSIPEQVRAEVHADLVRRLPALRSDRVAPASSAIKTASDEDIAHASALLSEGLLTPVEFQALTGMDAHSVPQYLADPARLVSVQRTCLQLRNSGAIARLEALRHAREAVTIAADIMRDSEMHPSTRLNAATFVAKASGTEKPAEQAVEARGRFTLTIIRGNKEPLVISTDSVQNDEERS